MGEDRPLSLAVGKKAAEQVRSAYGIRLSYDSLMG